MQLLIVLTLLGLGQARANDPSSEWFDRDERWPAHVGPLFDEADPDAYLHKVISQQSEKVNDWSGRYGSVSLDTTTECGLSFDGYLRKHNGDTYLILVLNSNDKKNHKLSWLPVEFRFDDGVPEYFMRRSMAVKADPNAKSPVRGRGTPEVRSRFKYLEVVRFPDTARFSGHDYLQIYLPWVDHCDVKPKLDFKRKHGK